MPLPPPSPSPAAACPRRPLRRWRAGVWALGLALTVAACQKHANPGRAAAEAEAAPVELAAVRRAPLERGIPVTGSLFGDEEATLRAKVAGQIVRIVADVGDRVEPGQELAGIDPTDHQLLVDQRQAELAEALADLGLAELPGEDFDLAQVATVRRARHQAANAQARLERAGQLFDRHPPLISEQDFQDIRTAAQVAQGDYEVALLQARSRLAQVGTRRSQLAAARQRLADTRIRAPGAALSGDGPTRAASTAALPQWVIVRRFVALGDYAREGDPLYVVVADDPIKYRAAVPERFQGQVAPGQAVSLRTEGSPEVFRGVVSRVTPAVDRQSRTFQVEAQLDNADHRLRPGAFAQATIHLGQEPDVVYVPRAAVVSFAGVDRVFTVAEGKAVAHQITLAAQDGDWLPIRETLDGHSQVVVGGAARLADGVAVRLAP